MKIKIKETIYHVAGCYEGGPIDESTAELPNCLKRFQCLHLGSCIWASEPRRKSLAVNDSAAMPGRRMGLNRIG